MPDSLIALAILALVGVPGYVYLQLVPRKQGSDDGSELNGSLETVFFGLACALGGVVLSLTSQDDAWTALLQSSLAPESDAEAAIPIVVTRGPFIAGVAFLGSVVTAILLAALVHLARAASRAWSAWRASERESDEQHASGAEETAPQRRRGRKRLAAHERSAGHAGLLLFVAAAGVVVTVVLGAWSDCPVADDVAAAGAETASDD